VRYGGEEFCIILPGTRRREAYAVGQRIREAIEKADFSETLPGVQVTGSLGVATLAEREALHEWLQRADIALFTAKHAGRNRVELAPASISESNIEQISARRLTVRRSREDTPDKNGE